MSGNDNHVAVTTDYPCRHVIVGGFGDIDDAPDLTGRDKHRVAAIFDQEAWEFVVWLPDWVLEDKRLQTVSSSKNVVVGKLTDHSDKAWRIEQRHIRNDVDGEFVPKSQAVVFERARGTDSVESPQSGLDAFGVDL